jgi:hypothetical protein
LDRVTASYPRNGDGPPKRRASSPTLQERFGRLARTVNIAIQADGYNGAVRHGRGPRQLGGGGCRKRGRNSDFGVRGMPALRGETGAGRPRKIASFDIFNRDRMCRRARAFNASSIKTGRMNAVDTPLLWGAVLFAGMRNSFRDCAGWRDELERT